MKLKSFGCSFIFGSDLSDTDNYSNVSSSLTWPAQLASKLGYDYSCYARPGAGNLQILEQVLNKVNDPGLFVIGWSWIDRYDYCNQTHHQDPWKYWQTIMPIDSTDLAKTYYRDLHSEYRDKFTSLSYIKLAIDTLEQKNIPFIMTYTDDLMFDQRWNTTPAVLELQQYIQPYMTRFNGQSFLEWSRSNGYLESNSWHPLEEAHLNAANYMIKVFDKQNTNGRWHLS